MTLTEANRIAQLRIELSARVDEADAVDQHLPTIGMLRSLMCRALAALDPDSDLPPERAIRIAEHALYEWRAFIEQPLTQSSTGG